MLSGLGRERPARRLGARGAAQLGAQLLGNEMRVNAIPNDLRPYENDELSPHQTIGAFRKGASQNAGQLIQDRKATAAALLPLYFLIFHVSYRKDRILAFLNPYADPKGFGFHIIQSLIAVATGGVTGLGLMEGKQKLFYLPEPHTDFIFAVTAEELGLVGALAVIILFAIFLWRGTRAALRTQDNFGRFLAVGITSMIVLQAFINISVVLGLMPTKGIPLPFVSYGGSSLFVTLMCVGVLLNITKQAE